MPITGTFCEFPAFSCDLRIRLHYWISMHNSMGMMENCCRDPEFRSLPLDFHEPPAQCLHMNFLAFHCRSDHVWLIFNLDHPTMSDKYKNFLDLDLVKLSVSDRLSVKMAVGGSSPSSGYLVFYFISREPTLLPIASQRFSSVTCGCLSSERYRRQVSCALRSRGAATR